jgi:poly [ADP-ribose] polymerase
MTNVIEAAKTGRARCRSCQKPIEKGALRFGEEQPSSFGEGMQMSWHHLVCAARKRPVPLREALGAFQGEVPDRAEIDQILSQPPEKGAAFPYAERAPTGRSKCQQCEQPIEKDTLRVAIEREVETGGMPRRGAGYLHPACAIENTGNPDLMTALKQNSSLAQLDLEELARVLST